MGQLDLVGLGQALVPGRFGFGRHAGGGLGRAPGEFAGVQWRVAAAGRVFLEERVQFFDGRFVWLLFVQAGGDFFVVGRALFKVGLGLLVALDDFCGQVLAFQFLACGFEFCPHVGYSSLHALQLFFEFAQALRAAFCAASVPAVFVLADAFDQFFCARQFLAGLVCRASGGFGFLGLGLFHALVQLAQALQLGLGLRVVRGGAFVLRYGAQGLQRQRQLRRDHELADRAQHRAPGGAGVVWNHVSLP
ncbi:MAG: hypothetical protein AB7I22_22000 [Ramlibacter sp.]